MASAFGDESADQANERVFAVAALMGCEGQWGDAVTSWVARTGGREFHANKCESEYANDPDRDKHKRNLKLYADLAQIIARSGLRGYGVALDLAAYREFFPGVPPGYEYYKCFAHVVTHLVEAARSTADLADGEPLKFTFDHRQDSEYNTGRIYDYMVNRPEWKDKNFFLDAEVSFGSRKNPRIQMADLVARETMKEMDNTQGPVHRPRRRSMEALLVGNGKIGLEVEILTRDYVRDWRVKMGEMEKATGMTQEGYVSWLRDHRLYDNWSNRIAYMIWSENEALRR